MRHLIHWFLKGFGQERGVWHYPEESQSKPEKISAHYFDSSSKQWDEGSVKFISLSVFSEQPRPCDLCECPQALKKAWSALMIVYMGYRYVNCQWGFVSIVCSSPYNILYCFRCVSGGRRAVRHTCVRVDPAGSLCLSEWENIRKHTRTSWSIWWTFWRWIQRGR